MTLWDKDDLVGRIQKSEDFHEWEFVRLPAEAEENDPLGRAVGEPLCPDRYDLKALHSRRRTLGRRNYLALYQQSPVAKEGEHFQRAWFDRTYAKDDDTYMFDNKQGKNKTCHERDVSFVVVVDPALGTKKGDKTGISVFGNTYDGRVMVMESIAERIPVDRLWARVSSMIDKWSCEYAIVEANGMQKLVCDNLRDHGILVREIMPGNKNKLMRAQKAIVMAEQGMIFIPDEDQPWVEQWLNEICDFTGEGDEEDQQVDTLSYMCLESERYGSSGEDDPIIFGGRQKY